MMLRILGMLAFGFLCGCANSIVYKDLTARTTMPDGVSSTLLSTTQEQLMTWGAFGTSSIWVAYPYVLPDTVVVAWRGHAWSETKPDARRSILLRPLLPPIDPAKQKYHLQFWFHPGDSLEVKVDVLEIGDCRHVKGIGATRTPHHGPCGVMNDW